MILSGQAPFNDARGKDIPSMLKQGQRLPKPEACDDKYV